MDISLSSYSFCFQFIKSCLFKIYIFKLLFAFKRNTLSFQTLIILKVRSRFLQHYQTLQSRQVLLQNSPGHQGRLKIQFADFSGNLLTCAFQERRQHCLCFILLFSKDHIFTEQGRFISQQMKNISCAAFVGLSKDC